MSVPFRVEDAQIRIGPSELRNDLPQVRQTGFAVAFTHVVAVRDGDQQLAGVLDEALLLQRFQTLRAGQRSRSPRLGLLGTFEAGVNEECDCRNRDEGGRRKNAEPETGIPEGLRKHVAGRGPSYRKDRPRHVQSIGEDGLSAEAFICRAEAPKAACRAVALRRRRALAPILSLFVAADVGTERCLTKEGIRACRAPQM